jgi:hypothetical protein
VLIDEGITSGNQLHAVVQQGSALLDHQPALGKLQHDAVEPGDEFGKLMLNSVQFGLNASALERLVVHVRQLSKTSAIQATFPGQGVRPIGA